jgi:hypothetical protein
LNFNYIAAQGDDGFWAEYSTNNGATWTTFTGGNVAASQCCDCFDAFLCGFGVCCGGVVACSGLGQGLWTSVNLAFPIAADNNPNVKFAFHWSNDGNGIGTDPSVAIDDITLTHSPMLSTEINSFHASSNNNTNQISWNCKSQATIDHFIIEQSTNGVNFMQLDKVLYESSVNASDFDITHEVTSDLNYYRLQIIKINGNIEQTQVISVKNELEDVFLVQSNEGYIVKGLEGKHGSINIYDLSGKLILPVISVRGVSHQKIELSTIGAGIYVINIISNQGSKQIKFQK